MSVRFQSAKIIAKNKIYETFIQPGYYIALTIGLLAAYFLVNGFIGSIDSSGFNYELHPLYAALGQIIAGGFGSTMVHKLFMEGPFMLILYIFLIPVVIYLSFSTVFRFGLEKKVGAVELVSYGPADSTSYFSAFFLKDILFLAISIAALLIVSAIAAVTNNLVLGPHFLFSLITAFFVSAVVFSYGVLSVSLTENGGSAIILFFAIIAFFLIVLVGSLSVSGDYVQSLFTTFSWIVRWISPFFYWGVCLRAVETGSAGMFIAGNLLLILLSAILLIGSHLILKAKGVRS
jgi:hypothetical protein